MWVQNEVHEAWGRWLSAMPWHAFCTLTHRPRQDGRHTTEFMFGVAKRFCKRFEVQRAVFGAETFKISKDVHLHGLLAWDLSYSAQDIQNICDIAWEWYKNKHGLCKIVPVCRRSSKKDVARCSLYISKYCMKDQVEGFDALLYGANKYWKDFQRVVLLEAMEKKVLDSGGKADIIGGERNEDVAVWTVEGGVVRNSYSEGDYASGKAHVCRDAGGNTEGCPGGQGSIGFGGDCRGDRCAPKVEREQGSSEAAGADKEA